MTLELPHSGTKTRFPGQTATVMCTEKASQPSQSPRAESISHVVLSRREFDLSQSCDPWPSSWVIFIHASPVNLIRFQINHIKAHSFRSGDTRTNTDISQSVSICESIASRARVVSIGIVQWSIGPGTFLNSSSQYDKSLHRYVE